MAKAKKDKRERRKPRKRDTKKPARSEKPVKKLQKKPEPQKKPEKKQRVQPKPQPKPKKELPGDKEKFMSSFRIDSSTHLETDIDKLYDIIEEKGKVTLAAVAKTLNSPEDKVRDWADILEEHDMIDIDYPVVGSPILKKRVIKEKTSQGIEKKVEEVDRKHKKRSIEPFIPLGVIGVSGLIIYLSSLKYTLTDLAMTLINQNPQVSDFINSLPFRESLFQNLVHIFFGIFSVLVIVIYLIIKFIRKK